MPDKPLSSGSPLTRKSLQSRCVRQVAAGARQTDVARAQGLSPALGFVAKLAYTGTAGTFQWARQLGNGQSTLITKLLVQGTNVFVAGSFSSATLVVGGTTLTLAGSYDGFVARLTDGANAPAFAWALSAGGPGYDIADALALSPTGQLYVGACSTALPPLVASAPPGPAAPATATWPACKMPVCWRLLPPTLLPALPP